jgi:hypothetical protein
VLPPRYVDGPPPRGVFSDMHVCTVHTNWLVISEGRGYEMDSSRVRSMDYSGLLCHPSFVSSPC